MNLDNVVKKMRRTVDSHKLSEGRYCRWLWQDEGKTRRLGCSEYGCADAANLLYTLGDFPGEPAGRAEWVAALREMQNPVTGLFSEPTHHTLHTTAHCIAALELFDALPLYPLTALRPYLQPMETVV